MQKHFYLMLVCYQAFLFFLTYPLVLDASFNSGSNNIFELITSLNLPHNARSSVQSSHYVIKEAKPSKMFDWIGHRRKVAPQWIPVNPFQGIPKWIPGGTISKIEPNYHVSNYKTAETSANVHFKKIVPPKSNKISVLKVVSSNTLEQKSKPIQVQPVYKKEPHYHQPVEKTSTVSHLDGLPSKSVSYSLTTFPSTKLHSFPFTKSSDLSKSFTISVENAWTPSYLNPVSSTTKLPIYFRPDPSLYRTAKISTSTSTTTPKYNFNSSPQSTSTISEVRRLTSVNDVAYQDVSPSTRFPVTAYDIPIKVEEIEVKKPNEKDKLFYTHYENNKQLFEEKESQYRGGFRPPSEDAIHTIYVPFDDDDETLTNNFDVNVGTSFGYQSNKNTKDSVTEDTKDFNFHSYNSGTNNDYHPEDTKDFNFHSYNSGTNDGYHRVTYSPKTQQSTPRQPPSKSSYLSQSIGHGKRNVNHDEKASSVSQTKNKLEVSPFLVPDISLPYGARLSPRQPYKFNI